MGLLQSFDLHGLGVGIATGPGTVTATDRGIAGFFHLGEGLGFEAFEQFSRKIYPTLDAPKPTGILKGNLMGKGIKTNRPLIQLLFKEVIEMDYLKVGFEPLLCIGCMQGVVALGTGGDHHFLYQAH